MGKVSKWLRGLLGLKKTDSSKRRWNFVKSYNNTLNDNDDDNGHNSPVDPNKHAMAVAAATAAVAEAAVAAAQAAAAVVRLTSSGRCGGGGGGGGGGGFGIGEEWAAVKIQAAFRGCLARRALRALKGLVKLQALVRGHIERKRTAERLKRLQTLLKAQARACAGRVQLMQASYSSSKSSICHPHGPATPEKFETPIRSKSMKYEQSPIFKRNGSKSCGESSEMHGNQNKSWDRSYCSSWNQGRSPITTYSPDDEKSDRILEIDSRKPHARPKHRKLSYSTSHASISDYYSTKSLTTTTKDSVSLQSGQTQTPSCEIQYFSPQKLNEVEETPLCTGNNSPQLFSATSKDDDSKRSPFTPTRSDGPRSYLWGYSDHPSYMAYTQSSKAKVRSLSAPRQRPQYERSGSSSRYSVNAFGEPKLATQRASSLQASFTSKAYPGSGRLDKLGMPVGYRY